MKQKRMIRVTMKMILADDPDGNEADGRDRARLNGLKEAQLLYQRSAVSGVFLVCNAEDFAKLLAQRTIHSHSLTGV